MFKVLNRFALFSAVILLTFVATRAMVRALPGDPLETLLAETGTSIPKGVLRAELQLDRPFVQATWDQTRSALRGDFGTSILSRRPIAPILLERFQKTLLLTLVSLGLTLLCSVTLAYFSVFHLESASGRILNRSANAVCTVHGALASAMPTPWTGPLLAWFFAVNFHIFPLGNHVALPALTIAFSFSGLWARLIRQRMRESLASGAAPGARARGIPEWKVILKYGLAPASGALLAYLGTQTGALLSGAFVTEMIFDWPGLGMLLVDAVLKRDYPVVEAAVFATASASIIGTWCGDWLQSFVDPRLERLEEK